MATPVSEPVTPPVPPNSVSDYERPEELLQRYHLSLTNAVKSPEILTELKKFKYDETRISEGLALYENVTILFSLQKKEKGEQLQASDEIVKCFTTARQRFITTRTIARIAFEDDANAFMALGLSGKTRISISGIIKQAVPFYTNIRQNPRFSARMAHFGYTDEKLSEEQNLIQPVLDADANHKKELGEAVEATISRDNTFDDLISWMSTFYVVAKEALKKKPELMKQLGM